MCAANKRLGLRDEEGGTVLGDGDPGMIWWWCWYNDDAWTWKHTLRMFIGWINYFHFNDWLLATALFPCAPFISSCNIFI